MKTENKLPTDEEIKQSEFYKDNSHSTIIQKAILTSAQIMRGKAEIVISNLVKEPADIIKVEDEIRETLYDANGTGSGAASIAEHLASKYDLFIKPDKK